MSQDEFAAVNTARQTTALGGGTYKDSTAAMEILGTMRKPNLKESPFVKYFFIGINNKGCWNSYHMSLQFKYMVDCAKFCTQEALISYSYLIIHRGTLANATVPSMLSTCQKTAEEQKNK
jgi:hypothetical protein